MADEKFHLFNRSVTADELPPRFTYPFCYTPHPLCVEAANMVKLYLLSQGHLVKELDDGKMLGVMVVEDADGHIGFIAAFSGNLCHSNNLPYFVPPIYDLLDPNGEFCRGEREISAINHQIDYLQSSRLLAETRRTYESERALIESQLEDFRAQAKREKAERDAVRASNDITAEQSAELVARSQYMKAELKRRKKQASEAIAQLDSGKLLNSLSNEIEELCAKRHTMSSHLQQRLFRLFVVKNALGGSCDLNDIFKDTTAGIPPAGAGECAAPKLMQYALTHGYKPRAMAEFWWGKSPAAEVRHHGNFYPACRSKCLPILTYMMQGLQVDPNPHDIDAKLKISIVYDDQWLSIVDKPSGLPTVPGKLKSSSLMQQYAALFPHASGPLIVHRLDMHTSGLLVIAKDKDTHKSLQNLLASRQVEKHYEALLNGLVADDQGIISLPLRVNPLDRPHQMVDFEHGKPAITIFKVISRANRMTRIDFRPITGRTHQLRLHAAHTNGLNAPILGDNLYGKQNEGNAIAGAARLCLHAKSLRFTHPVTGNILEVSIDVPF